MLSRDYQLGSDRGEGRQDGKLDFDVAQFVQANRVEPRILTSDSHRAMRDDVYQWLRRWKLSDASAKAGAFAKSNKRAARLPQNAFATNIRRNFAALHTAG